MSSKMVYWAVAKSVIGGDVFSCVFPRQVWPHRGDRVNCIDGNGEAKVGDILYADSDFPDRQILKELVDSLGAYKVVTLWERNDFIEEGEEGEEAE